MKMNLLQGMTPRRTPKPSGNMVVKVNSIDKDAGTIDATIMTGPTAGKDITFRPNGHLKVGDYAKKKGDSFTKEGEGTLRVEGLREGTDGVFDCRWTRTFLGNPREDHEIAYDQVSRLVMAPNSEKPRWTVRSLNIENEVVLKDIESGDDGMKQFRQAIVDGFNSDGNVTIFASSDKGLGMSYYYLGGKVVEGVFQTNDPEEQADSLIEDMQPEVLETLKDTFANGVVSVVPTKSINVGRQTAELAVKAIEEAKEAGKRPNISTVDPASFETPGLGSRVAISLAMKGNNEIPKEKADAFREAFLAVANDKAKEALHSTGWHAVPNSAIEATFESVGMNIQEVNAPGWAMSSFVLNPYEEGEDMFISKIFTTRMATPYPMVEAMKEARQGYFTEIQDALKDFPEMGMKKEKEGTEGPEGKAEKPDKEAAPKAEAPEEPEMDESSIDDLLNSVAGDEGLDDPDSEMQI